MPADFILENPEVAQSRKRRARVVMSCDYCRTKKIKCVPKAGQAKCDGCTEADKACTFRDRDRYHAERDRMYASQIAPESSSGAGEYQTLPHEMLEQDSYSSGYTTPLGSQGASMAVLSFPSSTLQPSTSSAVSAPGQLLRRISSRSATLTEQHPDPTFSPDVTVAQPATDPNITLVSRMEPGQPSEVLMPQYIGAFCNLYGDSFPFVTYECVVGAFLSSTLSPCLANCIASLTVPHLNNVSELATVNSQEAAELYARKAKDLVPSEESSSTADLKALILLSHILYQAGRMEELRQCTQRAVNVAFRLGLSNEANIDAISQNDSHRAELLALRKGIVDMHQKTLADTRD